MGNPIYFHTGGSLASTHTGSRLFVLTIFIREGSVTGKRDWCGIRLASGLRVPTIYSLVWMLPRDMQEGGGGLFTSASLSSIRVLLFIPVEVFIFLLPSAPVGDLGPGGPV